MTLHALVSRGAELVRLTSDDDEPKPMNPLALLVIALTFLVFLAVMSLISYTYGHVIPTLCMIETPSAQAYVPVNTVLSDAPPAYDEGPKPDDEEADIVLVQNKPITSSIRGTIAHLRAKAGWKSRFRGLSVFMVWNFCRSLITNIIGGAFMHPVAFAAAAIIAETMLARLHLTWVQ
jgi:formate/nitrite transporter FocA (FNT family)